MAEIVRVDAVVLGAARGMGGSSLGTMRGSVPIRRGSCPARFGWFVKRGDAPGVRKSASYSSPSERFWVSGRKPVHCSPNAAARAMSSGLAICDATRVRTSRPTARHAAISEGLIVTTVMPRARTASSACVSARTALR